MEQEQELITVKKYYIICILEEKVYVEKTYPEKQRSEALEEYRIKKANEEWFENYKMWIVEEIE